MTFSPLAPSSPAPAAAASGVVLVAPGSAGQVKALQRQVAPRLAALLRLELLGIAAERPPDPVLVELFERRPSRPDAPAWLAPLPLDPGFPLAAGGSWAQALGAWRQPTAALLSQDHLASGAPAALTALLRQSSVPLLGLIQCGGPWDDQARRNDGLPWLGCLDGADDDPAAAALGLAFGRRWRWLLED